MIKEDWCSSLLNFSLLQLVEELFAPNSVLLDLKLCLSSCALQLGELVETSDLFSLLLELLEPIDLVVKELLNGSRIHSFEFIEDAENHIELLLSDIGFLQHVFEGL